MNTSNTANDEGKFVSINGLRLTNVKTSFAAGFGLHHWSILEGELIA